MPKIGKFERKYRFPGGTVVKNPPASAGDPRDTGSMPGSGRFPWRRKWQLTPGILPGESHGKKSLVVYSSRACKKLNRTKVRVCMPA